MHVIVNLVGLGGFFGQYGALAPAYTLSYELVFYVLWAVAWPGSVDYHAAATELFLHAFDVGRNLRHHLDALPPDKVIIGYLNSDTTPEIVVESMRMLVTGRSNLPTTYKLLQQRGYPAFSGAMFWTIDADRREDYRYSNLVAPLLHGFPASSR
jgi:hypothetical protein